jgi:hypothetical protein
LCQSQVRDFRYAVHHQDVFRLDVSMNDSLSVNLKDSFHDLFENFFGLFKINFANQIGQTSIGTVLQYDSQEGFLTEVKELSCFKNVIMF